MDNIILTSTKNPLIKQVRKLHSAKERNKQNMLLLEGTNLVEAAYQVDYKLDIIFYTERWQENHLGLCRKIAKKKIKTQQVSLEVLIAIATTVSPDGVVAIAPRVIAQTPNIAQANLSVAFDRLQDPGNLGTIIRTASATMVDGLWLGENSIDIYNPKVLRASVGEWFRVPMGTHQNLAKLVEQHQQANIQVVATTSQATKTYWDIDFARPTLILFGNEGAGLSPELIEMADEQVTIPLSNQVESLNVAIANALVLYEAQRQSIITN